MAEAGATLAPVHGLIKLGEHREGRFIVLFALALIFHVLLPVFNDLPGLELFASVALVVIIGFAGWATLEARRWRVAYLIALVISASSTATIVLFDSAAWRGLWLAYHALLVGLDTGLVTNWAIRRERITLDTVAAGLSGYYLMGVAWAMVYGLIDASMAGAFSLPLAEGLSMQRAVYFSFVTLTTLGYGDILPTLPLTRAMASLQTLLAQIYLAVLVARLVMMQVDHRSREP